MVKSALVCGGSKGIGYASAMKLAEKGYAVTLLARNEEDLKLACSKLPSPNNHVHRYIAVDTNNIDLLCQKVEAKAHEIGQNS